MQQRNPTALALFLGLLALVWGCAHPARSAPREKTDDEDTFSLPVVRGPTPHRSQHPLLMTFLDFENRSAATTPPGEVTLKTSLVYTSMF